MPGEKRGGVPGIGVDAQGGGVVDPTQNVKDLSAADNKRQDDLREAERRYNNLRDSHQREIANLRAEHAKELAVKESGRLDSIRQVDREEVAKTAAQNNLAIGTLAKQTTDLATTLQAQVQATAQAAEARRQADMAEVNKRVSALELASSASAGKQTVADPALAALAIEVNRLASSRDELGGKAAIIDPQIAELKSIVTTLVASQNTRAGFDAGKAAMIGGGLLGGGAGIAALIATLMKSG